MFRQIFANRYAALIWVALTLFSAAAFVGEGGGREQLDAAAKSLQEQQKSLESPAAEPSQEADESLGEEPSPSLEPDAEQPRYMTGPNGERYRILTEDEAARVNAGEAARVNPAEAAGQQLPSEQGVEPS